MNGGKLPMLGEPGRGGEHQNGRVKKSHAPRPSSRLPDGHRRVAGFTLIEVLIALIVLVLGVLGAAAMTLNSLRDSKQSGLRTQASQLAYELGDLMRFAGYSQQAVFTAGSPGAFSACWAGTGCTPTQMATNDFYEWQTKAFGSGGTVGMLPNGSAKICRDISNTAPTATAFTATCDNLTTSPIVLKMKWDEKTSAARGQSASATAVTTMYLTVLLQPYLPQ